MMGWGEKWQEMRELRGYVRGLVVRSMRRQRRTTAKADRKAKDLTQRAQRKTENTENDNRYCELKDNGARLKAAAIM